MIVGTVPFPLGLLVILQDNFILICNTCVQSSQEIARSQNLSHSPHVRDPGDVHYLRKRSMKSFGLLPTSMNLISAGMPFSCMLIQCMDVLQGNSILWLGESPAQSLDLGEAWLACIQIVLPFVNLRRVVLQSAW